MPAKLHLPKISRFSIIDKSGNTSYMQIRYPLDKNSRSAVNIILGHDLYPSCLNLPVSLNGLDPIEIVDERPLNGRFVNLEGFGLYIPPSAPRDKRFGAVVTKGVLEFRGKNYGGVELLTRDFVDLESMGREFVETFSRLALSHGPAILSRVSYGREWGH